MYTIKQAALRSGVGISLLRAWERRYGVVTPERTASGYRLYDDAAIARLRAMRLLVETGWSASQAAEAVLNAPEPAPGRADSGAPPETLGGGGAEVDALVTAATVYDTAGIEAVLDGLFAHGSYEAVIDSLVLPSVAALGPAWAAGRIDVAAEHLASAAVVRRLSTLFDHAGAAGSGPQVLVGLPPGSRHEIGALACAVALRRRGIDVLYLGPDVPVASWVHATAESAARAVILGVTRPADVAGAREVATAIRGVRASVIVTMGGATAEEAADGVAIVLPPSVTEAAVQLAGLLGGR
jgi:DNA-binding transcriptional MerR regulator/methylmalonyl-CoA mutase cobalamin-binding subunit